MGATRIPSWPSSQLESWLIRYSQEAEEPVADVRKFCEELESANSTTLLDIKKRLCISFSYKGREQLLDLLKKKLQRGQLCSLRFERPTFLYTKV